VRPRRFAEWTTKVSTRARARGVREVARALAAQARGAIGSENALIVLSADLPGPPPEGGWRVAEASPADGPRYARDIGTESRSTFVRRLGGGTTCYLVFSGDRIVHATWASTSSAWIGEIGRWFCPPPRSMYLYESFTRPDARGMGIYPFALRSICARGAQRGLERLWIAVLEDNAASRRAIGKAGFEIRFTVPYRRRWGRITPELPSEANILIRTECLPQKDR